MCQELCALHILIHLTLTTALVGKYSFIPFDRERNSLIL